MKHLAAKQLSRQGFSLIELITVVLITAILSISIASVMVNTQIRGTRASTIGKVRQEGELIVDHMSFTIRNARFVIQNQTNATCSTGMSALRLQMPRGEVFEFFQTSDNRIASNSASAARSNPSSYLSSTAVRVQNLRFDCTPTTGQNGALIKVTFNLDSGNPSTTSPESYYTQAFSTQVYVRSY